MIELRPPARPETSRGPIPRLVWLAGVFVAELVTLAAAYQFFAQIECRNVADQALCEGLKSLVARAIVVLAVACVVMLAHPEARSRFVAGARPACWLWPCVHLAGLGLLFLPLLRVGSGDLGADFGAAVGPWFVGTLAGVAGGLLWLAPARAWGRLMRDLGPVALAALAVAVVTPDLAEAIRPIWEWSVLTGLTFNAVAMLLSVFTPVSVADPSTYVIGVRDFAVHISRQCSGVEGFALVTAFVAIYAVIFRRALRIGRFLCVVLPVALALSWLLNVLRIGLLILVGANLSPTVAVNGFHSYAGWLFFTLLALGLVAVVQVTPWLHHGGAVRTGGPLRRDPVAVAIVPFIAFMVVSTVVSALAPHPEVGYPVKALVLLAVVIAFWPGYRLLLWRLDPVALAAGVGVGVFWMVLAEPGDPQLSGLLAAMTPGSYASWLALRLLGTILLVPLIEEMFFRGYVMRRLEQSATGFPWGRVMAIAVSTAAFAALHGRWIEAGVAGVIFALLALRCGQATDAVQGHVVANAVIALVAVWTGDFSLI